jgi:hypothetical protein
MKITASQLRQIIKEELRRTLSEGGDRDHGYGMMQSSSIHSIIKKPGVAGKFSSSTSILEDGPYTWEIQFAPDFLDSLANNTDKTALKVTRDADDYEVISSIQDGIRVYMVKGPKDFLDRLDIHPDDFPVDSVDFVLEPVKFFTKLSEIAKSQGKTNLSRNLLAVAEAKKALNGRGTGRY